MIWQSTSAQQTQALARQLAAHLFPGAVVALWGDLGAGKTAFVRGLAQGMGVAGRVHSPTFGIVHEHAGTPPLYHFDLYRLTEGLADSGLDEYFDRGGVCALEWPGRAGDELPQERLDVFLRGQGEQARTIEMQARGARHQTILESMQ
ncbi:MAG: tRNA (adenosine(37)-N6)-threonylcarbamoyltransferase complex ATPase subunit type 1 TsaE [Eubacteriales bacterium]|nr:tRNA (adenosine(37)-N6)-threonylcarbamoyltransferase complex ATPase subunit type 1 TsaE [Eubacteriales bacterium]